MRVHFKNKIPQNYLRIYTKTFLRHRFKGDGFDRFIRYFIPTHKHVRLHTTTVFRYGTNQNYNVVFMHTVLWVHIVFICTKTIFSTSNCILCIWKKTVSGYKLQLFVFPRIVLQNILIENKIHIPCLTLTVLPGTVKICKKSVHGWLAFWTPVKHHLWFDKISEKARFVLYY